MMEIGTVPMEVATLVDLLDVHPNVTASASVGDAFAVDVGEYRLALATDPGCEQELAERLPYASGFEPHPVARTLLHVARHIARRLRGTPGKPFRVPRPAQGLRAPRITTIRTPNGHFQMTLGLRAATGTRVHLCHPDPRTRLTIANVLRGTDDLRVVGSTAHLDDFLLRKGGRYDLLVVHADEAVGIEFPHPDQVLVIGSSPLPSLRSVRAPGAEDIPSVRDWTREVLLPKLNEPVAQPVRPPSPISVPPVKPRRVSRIRKPISIVAIAASTGGPDALLRVLKGLPADFPLPIVLVQHMSEKFTEGFAARINRNVALEVRQAVDGDRPVPGTVLLAPGGHHLEVSRDGGGWRVQLTDGPHEHGCRPAADVMFRSLECAKGEVLAVVLTGMGEDGGQGAKDLFDAGATVLAQDQASSVVWGMPGAVVRRGAADEVISLHRIPERIQHWVNHASD